MQNVVNFTVYVFEYKILWTCISSFSFGLMEVIMRMSESQGWGNLERLISASKWSYSYELRNWNIFLFKEQNLPWKKKFCNFPTVKNIVNICNIPCQETSDIFRLSLWKKFSFGSFPLFELHQHLNKVFIIHLDLRPWMLLLVPQTTITGAQDMNTR